MQGTGELSHPQEYQLGPGYPQTSYPYGPSPSHSRSYPQDHSNSLGLTYQQGSSYSHLSNSPQGLSYPQGPIHCQGLSFSQGPTYPQGPSHPEGASYPHLLHPSYQPGYMQYSPYLAFTSPSLKATTLGSSKTLPRLNNQVDARESQL